MEREIAIAAMEFLKRVDLKGAEAPTMYAVMAALQRYIQPVAVPTSGQKGESRARSKPKQKPEPAPGSA